MVKKLFMVALVVVIVVISEILLTTEMPAIRSMVDMANYTGSNNYVGFNEAVQTSKIWLYFIPVVVGFVVCIMILRSREQ